MTLLQLSGEVLLTTTRTVRKRLDLERPVDLALVREALTVALQAPSGSNRQGWHFVVVTDAAKRAAIGDYYRRAVEDYLASEWSAAKLPADDPDRAPRRLVSLTRLDLEPSRPGRDSAERVDDVAA